LWETRHCNGGGYFPCGGSGSIDKTMTAAIEGRGGQVFSISKVEEIITKKTILILGQYKAVGVCVRGVEVQT